MKIECVICGKTVESKGNNRKYCSVECNKEGQRRINLEKHYRKAEENARKKMLKPNQAIIDIQLKAREHGLTYGQYVAMMEGGAR